MQLNSVIGSPAYRTVHHWLMRCEKRPMIEETDFLVNTYVLGLQMWFMVMNVVLMANLHYFRHLILANYDRDDRLKWRLLNRRQIVLHKLRRAQENKSQLKFCQVTLFQKYKLRELSRYKENKVYVNRFCDFPIAKTL